MITYFKSQIKEDGEWRDDPTHTPIAIRRAEVHILFDHLDLDDDTRMVRIRQCEALENNHGEIFWVTVNRYGGWDAIVLPVFIEPLYFWLPDIQLSLLCNYQFN